MCKTKMAAPMFNKLAQRKRLLILKSPYILTSKQTKFKLNIHLSTFSHKCNQSLAFHVCNSSLGNLNNLGFARPTSCCRRYCCDNPLIPCRRYSSLQETRRRERQKLFGSEEGLGKGSGQKKYFAEESGINDTSMLVAVTGILTALAVFAVYMRRGDSKKNNVAFLISKALIAERQKKPEEAEALMHEALHLAQKTDKQEAVTYTLDQMANLALRRNQEEKAEKLIKDTINHLIANGVDKTSNAVIELSIKLANIYCKFNKYEEAYIGYNWCITTLENKMHKPDDSNDLEEIDRSHEKEEESDIKALLGMSLENYAKLLAKQKRYSEAETAYLRAIEICQNDLSKKDSMHPQTVVLLNDLGTLYNLQKKYKEAIDCLERAIEAGKSMSHPDVTTPLCNLASCQMYTGDFESANKNYQKALKSAEHEGDQYSIKIIKDMMAQLETEKYLKERNKKS